MVIRLKLRLVALGLAIVASPVAADPTRAVVELFTSQGCMSCPPADALLSELARRPDIVALSLPVDYWDYLGWKDTLAQPGFSRRQRAYAHLRGDGQVYTPQVIVNGTALCLGSDRAGIERSIGRADRPPLPVAVTAAERDGKVIIEIDGQPDGSGMRPADLWVLPVLRARIVAIGRGENRGRTITYSNVVTGFVRVGEWRGGAGRFEIPLAEARGEADGYVVLLQAAQGSKPGPILGAAKGPGF
jgi:hypothetical protein